MSAWFQTNGMKISAQERWASWARRLKLDRKQPAQLLSPRLSTLGVWLIGTLMTLFCLMLTLAVYYTDIRSELRTHAQSRAVSVDLLIKTAIGEMTGLTPPEGAGCTGPLTEALVRASMDSSIARRFYVVSSDRSVVCSPLVNIGDPAARMLTDRGHRMRGDITLMVIPDASNDVLLVSQAGIRGYFAAQIPGTLVRDLLDVRSRAGYVDLKIRSWSGGSIVDTGWDEAYETQAFEWLAAEADSEIAPITIRASARASAVIAGAWRYALAAFLLATILSILVVSQINFQLERRASALSRIRKALMKRQFEPVVQPIVDCNTGRCVGGEVLMRWRHPVRGLLAPNEFIDIAERNGLIDEMTQLIMLKARDRLAPVVQAHPDLYFSFNVTVGQLRRENFADELDKIFDSESVPSSNVVIELVERDVVDASSCAMLATLRERGYRVAIDDFGTGQSSLSLLTNLSFDYLKIDREFVRAIDTESVHQNVLTAIVELAARLGVRSIAEGVETEKQHQFLIQRGVNAVQGFLMARPMQIEAFYGWLEQNRQKPTYAHNKVAVSRRTVARKAEQDVRAWVGESNTVSDFERSESERSESKQPSEVDEMAVET